MESGRGSAGDVYGWPCSGTGATDGHRTGQGAGGGNGSAIGECTGSDPGDSHLPEFQNVFGAGLGWLSLQNQPNNGTFRLAEDGTPIVAPSGNSFGPKMEGQMVRWWDGQMRPFSPQPHNFRDLYDSGHNVVNTVAFSNATERARYRLGYTRTDWAGVFPGNRQDRNSLTLTGNLNISSRLTTELSLNYYNTATLNPPPKWYMAYSFPRSLRTDMLRTLYKTGEGYQLRSNEFPLLHSGEARMLREIYWTGLEEQFEYDEDHLIGALGANYQFNDWLDLRLRAGSDIKNANQEIRQPSTQPESTIATGYVGCCSNSGGFRYANRPLRHHEAP